MSEEKIGGISLDDIKDVAMDGLENSSNDISKTSSSGEKISADGSSLSVDNVSTDGRVIKKNDPSLDDGNSGYVGTVTSNKDDVYTIGNTRLVNVTNKLSSVYENLVGNIMSYIDENRTVEAMQMAQDLVDHNMSNEVAWLVYAYAKAAWGDREMAQKGFEQAIAINPVFALALNDYGAFLLDNDDVDTAMIYFNKALDCDPKNVLYMRNVAFHLMFTDSYGAAIDKCKYFIDISDEKTYLENTLGAIYVEMCKSCIADVPIDLDDPSAGTEPGFVYLSDIKEVRKNCLIAKSLLTLEEFKDELEHCEELLKLCDEDQYNTFRIKKMPYLIFHTIITVLIYGLLTFCTFGVCLPLLIVATYANIKCSYFPMYMLNYAYCTGTDDPLKYKEGSLRESMSQGFIDGWRSDGNNSLGSEFALSFIQSRIWFLRARIAFYKRFIQERRDKKKNMVDSVIVDDIQSQA